MNNLIQFFKNMARYAKNNLISTILWLLSLAAIIGYFANDLNHSYFIAFLLLYIPGTVYDKSRFIDRIMSYAIKYPKMSIWELTFRLKINPRLSSTNHKKTLFESIVFNTIRIAGILMVLYAMYILITTDVGHGL